MNKFWMRAIDNNTAHDVTLDGSVLTICCGESYCGTDAYDEHTEVVRQYRNDNESKNAFAEIAMEYMQYCNVCIHTEGEYAHVNGKIRISDISSLFNGDEYGCIILKSYDFGTRFDAYLISYSSNYVKRIHGRANEMNGFAIRESIMSNPDMWNHLSDFLKSDFSNGCSLELLARD